MTPPERRTVSLAGLGLIGAGGVLGLALALPGAAQAAPGQPMPGSAQAGPDQPLPGSAPAGPKAADGSGG